jgi:hypothetical protein
MKPRCLSRQNHIGAYAAGKALSLLQTARFMVQNPLKILTGDGMGNFSSKLAFRATGLGIAGGYPLKYKYISNNFMLNHLDLYLNFFSKQTGLHSLTNSPFSVYDQLLSEYGLLALLAFAVYYLWFFARYYQNSPMACPCCCCCWPCYWLITGLNNYPF